MDWTILYVINGLLIVYILSVMFKNNEQLNLYVGILSSRCNFQQRKVIRQTWLTELVGNEFMDYIFILGEACDIPVEQRVQHTCNKINFNDLISNNTTHLCYALTMLDDRQTQSTHEAVNSLAFLVNSPITITHVGILSHCLKEVMDISLMNDANDNVVIQVRTSIKLVEKTINGYSYFPIDNYFLPVGYEGSIEILEPGITTCNVTDLLFPETNFQNGLITIYSHFGEPYNLAMKIPTLNFIYKPSNNTSRVLNDEKRTCGKSEVEIQQEISNEQKKFNDLLITEVADVYRNLPQKLLHFFKFISPRRPRYVLKLDDDSYLNVGKLLTKLQTLSDKRDVWWGNFRVNWEVNLVGKWRELGYRSSAYPPFACGSGYLIDSRLLSWIVLNHEHLHPYQGEDVSMGIWLSAIGPELVQDSDWTCDDRCREGAITVGELSPREMTSIHERMVHYQRLCY